MVQYFIYKNKMELNKLNILKIALIQHKAKANNINKNLELGLKYVKEVKEKEAYIVLFP